MELIERSSVNTLKVSPFHPQEYRFYRFFLCHSQCYISLLECDIHVVTSNGKMCCVFVGFRQLLLCRVALGKSFLQFSAMKMAHAPPGHHSIIGRPSVGGLSFAEYVVYRGEQVSHAIIHASPKMLIIMFIC